MEFGPIGELQKKKKGKITIPLEYIFSLSLIKTI